jgi:ADP-ribose pyrophosphatase
MTSLLLQELRPGGRLVEIGTPDCWDREYKARFRDMQKEKAAVMNEVKQDLQPKTVLGTGRFLKLVCERGWEYVERRNASGVAVIVGVTEDNKLLLTEQFRPPVGNRVIELPAGLAGDGIGEENEDLMAAGRRELLEEVGYEAKEMRWVGHAPSSAGLASQVVTFFLAIGLKKVGAGGGDGEEEITVHEVQLELLREWLGARIRDGIYLDPELFAGLYFAGYM